MPGKDKKRHVVTVMRPAEAVGSLGQTQGQPTVIYREWPCSIKTLNGNESDDVRQVGASRTFEVEGYTDPAKQIRETDYLTLGSRKLHVAFIDDEQQNGVMVRLICGENL